jgi:hypothetical protein
MSLTQNVKVTEKLYSNQFCGSWSVGFGETEGG